MKHAHILSSLVVAFGLAVPAVAAAFPSRGEVAGDNVNVRSGGSLNHQVIASLKKGDEVTVLGERGGWFKVTIPSDARLYVSDKFVGPDGTVTATRLNVRPRPNTRFAPIGQMKKGDTVAVKERLPDGWLAIEAPDGTCGWILGKYIKVTGEAASASDARTPATGTKDDQTMAATMKEADDIFYAEMAKPLQDMDYTRALDLYREVEVSAASDSLRERARARGNEAGRLQGLAEEHRAHLHEAAATGQRAPAPTVSDPQEAGFDPGLAIPAQPEYIAEGWVDDMGLHFAREATHKLVKGGRTLFLLRSSTIDLRGLVGKRIKVKGEVTSSIYGNEPVVDVTEVSVLTD